MKEVPSQLVRVKTVTPLESFKARLEFENGAIKEVDLEPYLWGPIFEPVRQDRNVFQAMSVREGTLCWPNGADIDPDVLYYGLTPAWKEISTASS